MSYQLVNKTLSLVEREIDNFLGDFPDDHPYQMALSLPYFRQVLKAKVLNKVPNRHHVISEDGLNTCSPSLFQELLEERLLIEEAIRLVMPNLIHDIYRHKIAVKPVPKPWWIKVHTIIPCVTYFFGPFESLEEAQQNHWGYIEDLITEKAMGITFGFQNKQPQALTLMDSPAELKQDLQTVWQQACTLKSRLANKQKLLESLPGNYLVTNLQGIIQSVNANVCNFLGLTSQEIIGQSFAFFVHQKDWEIFYVNLEAMKENGQESEGTKCWSIALETPAIALTNVDIETTSYQNSQGEIVGWYWLLHDTSKLYEISQQNYYDSHHDPLTSLPNRRSLFGFLSDLIKDRQNQESKLFSLLLLDLNDFKKINDRFGHRFGDQVLIAIAERLLTCVRPQDKVTRLSGDEFAIILEEMSSSQEAKDFAYRIHHALSNPLQIGNESITVTASIGIVISNGRNADYDHLFYCADMAMYESKRNLSPFVIFDDVSSEALQLKKQLHLDPAWPVTPIGEQNGSCKSILNSDPESLKKNPFILRNDLS